MTYPMDEETKEYIDGKFARMETDKAMEAEKASSTLMAHRRRTKRIVYTCAAVLLLLLGVQAWLLYHFQFRAWF